MTPRILIVDDEPTNLATIEGFFSDENYELHFATNGIDACAQAELLHPDLILLDVMMPGMDGFSVCRRIRATPEISRVPIIIVTALDDDESRLNGLSAGADDFLNKPCRCDEMRARVRTIVMLNRFRESAEQRARFENLFHLAPDMIVLLDAAGRIAAGNAAAQKAQLAVGGRLDQVFDAAASSTLDQVVEALRSGHAANGREVRLHLGNEDRIFSVRGTTVPDGDARLVLLMFDDITDRVRAREEMERMNQSLEAQVRARTQQLEDANRLLLSYASFVSHDLRTPLALVKGYLSFILSGASKDPVKTQDMLQRSFAAALSMQEMIENILSLAQSVHDGTAATALSDTDPAPVIGKLIGRVRDMAEGTPPEFHLGPLPRIGVNAVVLERVFYNLLVNAMKYSAGQPTPRIEVFGVTPATRPVIAVRDNGIGFDSRDHSHLFAEFSRLPNAGKTDGWGLGLSLVARIVRTHGGRIWAESKIGHGATFYVELPPPAAATSRA